jgi:hypothetical protein
MNIISTNTERTNSFSELSTNLSLSKRITLEKRKRHQAYTKIDYLLGVLTYFDFFSRDTFQIIKNSIFLSQILDQNLINSESVLLACLDEKLELSKVLKEYDLSQSELLEKLFVSNSEISNKKFPKMFKNKSSFASTSQQKEIMYSSELNQLFEKTVENGLNRFKTPVVTPTLLFITLMEEKNSKAGKIIKKSLKSDANWYLLRYRLIKDLHSQEVLIRGEISKNQHYFAYLMKTRFSEFDFNKLIKNDLLITAVSFFRNSLVKEVLKQNIFSMLSNEISTSIKTVNKRKYS